MPVIRLGHQMWFLAVAVACLVLGLAACQPTEPYSTESLRSGIDHNAIGDGAMNIERVTVLHPFPDELPTELIRRLDGGDVGIVHNGFRGFDVAILYKAEPFCGRLPTISVEYLDEVLSVDVRSHIEGDCVDIVYVEVVGIDYVDGIAVSDVSATHGYVSRR